MGSGDKLRVALIQMCPEVGIGPANESILLLTTPASPTGQKLHICSSADTSRRCEWLSARSIARVSSD